MMTKCVLVLPCSIVYNTEMFYIVALGNPGQEYEKTRHNVGWLAADALVAQYNFTKPIANARLNGLLSQGLIADTEVDLLYPTTFMNHSGQAALKLVPKGEAKQLIVLQDETALPIGQIKVSVGRQAGGHNGVQSIISALGTTDFVRVRIGVAPTTFFTGTMKVIKGDKIASFVLGKFTGREEKVLAEVLEEVKVAVKTIIERGPNEAMNQFNGRN